MDKTVIGVLGLGFVGLTTALGLCEKTNCTVVGFEKNEEKLNALERGCLFFEEPGLENALHKHYGSQFLLGSDSLPTEKKTLKDCSLFFICVGTPCDDAGNADLTYLKNAVVDILNAKSSQKQEVPFTIAIKSTVPPSTVSEHIAPLCSQHGFQLGEDVFLCSNPEFLREGKAWDDFIHPDRIVIGEFQEGDGAALRDVYLNFNCPIVIINANTAEFIKYSSNTLLATLISFSNELAMIGDSIGDIDIAQAFHTLHMDKRWHVDGQVAAMSSYAYPGCGFGGYCLPKDTQAMIGRAEHSGYNASLLRVVLEKNREVKQLTAKKIIEKANGGAVGILGLSFNVGSDDVRNSPSAEIIQLLLDEGLSIFAYDPISMENFKNVYHFPITYCENGPDVLKCTAVVAILTAWPEFARYDYSKNDVIDGRYLLST